MNDSNTILVTGGAGFIGSHVVDRLLEQGKNVVCIDDLNDFYSPQAKKANIYEHLKNPKYHLAMGDICDFAFLKKVFDTYQFDVVIHLAARAGVRPSIENPLLYQEVNIRGTLQLLECAHKHNVQKFVFGSSSSVYGNNTNVPFSETDHVDHPISPYAATKKAAELLCHTYHHLYGMDITCLRFFTVLGPRGRPDMAPYKFTKLILDGKEIEKYGDGSSARDYTYVSDIVEGIVASMALSGFEIINLGNSKPITLNDFIALIERVTEKSAHVREMPTQKGDVQITYADIKKAKELLHWEPRVGIEEGMRKFVQWYRKI